MAQVPKTGEKVKEKRISLSSPLSLAQIRTEQIKQWATIIAVIGSLATAITAHFKTEKEETAKATYSELSNAVQKLSEEQIKLHNDIANLRGYMAGASDNQHHQLLAALEAYQESQSKRSAPKISKTIAVPEKEEHIPQISQKPAQYKPPSIDTLMIK